MPYDLTLLHTRHHTQSFQNFLSPGQLLRVPAHSLNISVRRLSEMLMRSGEPSNLFLFVAVTPPPVLLCWHRKTILIGWFLFEMFDFCDVWKFFLYHLKCSFFLLIHFHSYVLLRRGLSDAHSFARFGMILFICFSAPINDLSSFKFFGLIL